jgi:hypothetical protein
VDYPHPDSTWPNTQELLRSQLAGFPADIVEQVTWKSASQLFRHPVPERYVDDPELF